jgi:regulator of RNase E activity RraA
MGEGMAKTLYAAGCVDVVTDGGVRDVNGLLSVPFAAYCKGKTVHHCPLRIRSINQPVEIGGIRLRPGDIIHANAEGVIKIPSNCLNKLAGKASQMRAAEHEAHSVLRRTDLAPARKRKEVDEIFLRWGFS